MQQWIEIFALHVSGWTASVANDYRWKLCVISTTASILFCDQDVDSIDDLDIAGVVDMSDSLNEASRNGEDIFDDDLYDNIDNADDQEEEEALYGHALGEITPPLQGQCKC